MIIKDTKLKARYFISLNIMPMYSRIANFKPQKSTQHISIFFRKTHKTCQCILELLILNFKKVYNTFQYFFRKTHKTQNIYLQEKPFQGYTYIILPCPQKFGLYIKTVNQSL